MAPIFHIFMKNFHFFSFGLGLGSGVLVLLLILGGMRAFGSASLQQESGERAGNWQQMRSGNGEPNMAAMAGRFGMTEAQLQSELDSGKTMRDIAREKGVELPVGRRMAQASSATASGSTGVSSSAQASAPSAQ